MLSSPEFWVFVSFVLFIALLGKRAFSFFTKVLDEHTKKVTRQVAEAQRLHDEALSLLNTYKKKHADALKQAEEILSYAETEAKEFKKSSEEELKRFLAIKEKSLLERIELDKEETRLKLQQQTVDEAISQIEIFLSKNIKEREKLTEASLQEIVDLSKKAS